MWLGLPLDANLPNPIFSTILLTWKIWQVLELLRSTAHISWRFRCKFKLRDIKYMIRSDFHFIESLLLDLWLFTERWISAVSHSIANARYPLRWIINSLYLYFVNWEILKHDKWRRHPRKYQHLWRPLRNSHHSGESLWCLDWCMSG